MKKLLIALLFLIFAVGIAKADPILVPSYGETGWQTWSWTHTEVDPWSGVVGIGVSDEGDENVRSYLLVDNLIGMGPAGPPTNQGFELGDFTGYTLYGAGSVGASAVSLGGTTYNPTEGSLMAILDSLDNGTGVSTQFLQDAGIDPTLMSPTIDPTDGSYITFGLTLTEGDTVSFDWNFMTTDYWSLEDFAFMFAADAQGQLDYVETLAKIGPTDVIPEPATLLLLGSGLLGLAGLRKKKSAS